MAASFHTWVKAVFDHPVEDPEWFWQPDFDDQWEELRLTPGVTVDYLTKLYREPEVLRAYTLVQIAQALWFLVGESSPGEPSHALLEPSLPIDSRIRCVEAVAHFFRQFVVPATADQPDSQENPFHVACFMWWDIFPLRPDSGQMELERACLRVMQEILDLPSEVCQLSALHGLNHWYPHYGAEVSATVDTFLRSHPNLGRRVAEYANLARLGRSI